MLESNVHYPTDTSLLWDSARKCLDLTEQLSRVYSLSGWRKASEWRRRLKTAERAVTQAFRTRGESREEKVVLAGENYVAIAAKIYTKLTRTMAELLVLSGDQETPPAKIKQLSYYYDMLFKFIDIVRRRLIEGEKIPQSEKLFSIFQPKVEWIAKGKAGKWVELGHKVLIATDQFGMILYHKVVEKTDDRDLAVPLAQELHKDYKIKSLSLDKGFYSKVAKDLISELVPNLVMPKKGKLNQTEAQEESSRNFKELRNRHCAVESNINQLEHNGLNRCPDKGLEAMKRYAAFGVLSYNLHRVGKAVLAERRKKEEKEEQRLKSPNAA